jgi:hypothetical protein
MAGIKNWKVDQSTHFRFTIIYKDSAGNPINLAQFSQIRMDVKSAPGSKKVLATSDLSDGISVVPSQGRIDVTFSPEKTKVMSYPKSAYDLVLVDGNNIQTRILEGWLEISRAVTVID